MSKDEGSVDFQEAGKAALGVLHNLGTKGRSGWGFEARQAGRGLWICCRRSAQVH
jgi:hypothetical protein